MSGTAKEGGTIRQAAADMQLISSIPNAEGAVVVKAGTGDGSIVEYGKGAGSGNVLREDEEDLEVKLRRIIENVPVRVSNTSGSSAGSGSGDFHQYRQMRRKEQDRLTRMDVDYQRRKELVEFNMRREERLKAAEERTSKKRAKRQKKKLKRKEKRNKTYNGEEHHHHRRDGSSESDDSDDPDAEPIKYSMTKAFVIAFIMTFFSIFDVPVFWPILLLYWVVLFTATMKRQILHMIKYRYVPFTFGKQRYDRRRAATVEDAGDSRSSV